MRQFLDRPTWQAHLDRHNEKTGINERLKCPHPRAQCDEAFESAQELRFHLQDIHCAGPTGKSERFSVKDHAVCNALDKSCPEGPFVVCASMREGISSKRKCTDDQHTLNWMPMQTSRPARAPKKSRKISPTEFSCPIPSTDTTILCDRSQSDPNIDPLDLEPYLSDVDGLRPTALAQEVSRELERRSESSTCDEPVPVEDVVGDDSIFSQFLRSPTPTSFSTDADLDQSLVDRGASDLTSSDHPAPCKPAKIRIHLRVGSPKPRIKLRVTDPTTKERYKRRKSKKVRQSTPRA